MKSFFDCTRDEIAEVVGRPARATKLYKSVYQERAEGFDGDAAAASGLTLGLPVIVRRFDSADGTRRYLLRLADGEEVESVLILEEDRLTFCISSQVGCALACTFCLTGQLGLTRNLTAGEIVSQVVLLQREALTLDAPQRFSVVFMGMGEPLQNYDSVMKAVRILHDDHSLAVPLHRITVSTAGLLPGIERLADEPMFPNLSISLTGVTDEVRDVLMPINRKYPLQDVISSVRSWPVARQKRVMLEYVMLQGITDSIEDARRLASVLQGMHVKVNLIAVNEATEIPYKRPDRSVILAFQEVLVSSGITTFIRRNRGNDISGACGQLKKMSS